MAKLIDSENVIAWLNAQIEKVQGGWLHDYGFPTNVIVALTDVKRFVKNLPTIEAEPVRHGRWINTNETVWDAKEIDGKQQLDISIVSAKCSVCGRWAEQVNNFPPYMKYNYCPNCGARMDATEPPEKE